MTIVKCDFLGSVRDTKLPPFGSVPTPAPCLRYDQPGAVNIVVWAAISKVYYTKNSYFIYQVTFHVPVYMVIVYPYIYNVNISGGGRGFMGVRKMGYHGIWGVKTRRLILKAIPLHPLASSCS